MSDPYFEPSWLLLQQEAQLCRSTLALGLNALVQVTVGQTGLYYAGFFNLSVGVERLLKMTLILRHMGANGLATPTEKELRSFGHDLVKLFDVVASGSDEELERAARTAMTDSFESRILRFLSTFATNTRYYNLNRLVAHQAMTDPLTEWQRILEDLLEHYGNRRRMDRHRARAMAVAEALKDRASVVFHGLDQTPYDLEDLFTKPLEYREASRHAIWHVYRPLQLMRNILCDASGEVLSIAPGPKMPVPDMGEFFTFLNYERPQVLRKRRWP